MKISFISDTHGIHAKLKIPEYDLVIHCGDEANSANIHKNEKESRDFFEWFEALPGLKVFVPGNHSVAIERKRLIPPVPCLNNSYINISGWGIYGSPWTPSHGSQQWAYIRHSRKMLDIWELIPKCDILVTHGPPKGILDLTSDRKGNNHVHCGCRSLMRKVLEIRPKVFAFGHIHSDGDNHNSGIYQNYGITFINCSVVNDDHELINDGFVYEIS